MLQVGLILVTNRNVAAIGNGRHPALATMLWQGGIFVPMYTHIDVVQRVRVECQACQVAFVSLQLVWVCMRISNVSNASSSQVLGLTLAELVQSIVHGISGSPCVGRITKASLTLGCEPILLHVIGGLRWKRGDAC